MFILELLLDLLIGHDHDPVPFPYPYFSLCTRTVPVPVPTLVTSLNGKRYFCPYILIESKYSGKKSIFWSKVKVFVESNNFGQKIYILVESKKLAKKILFWSKVKNWPKKFYFGGK